MTEARYAAIAGLVISDVAPTVNDDTDRGYNRTTLWFDTTTGAPDAAVWEELTVVT